MRQIGTVPDAHAARTFADYLATLKIDARLDHQAHGWGLWVFDEDRVPQAKSELEQYLRNPDDPRFARAAAPAAIPDRAADPVDQDAEAPPFDRSVLRRLLTLSLAAACVTVYFTTNFGDSASPVVQALEIAPDGDTTLAHVRQGELWRLVSPIFLHFSLPHIVFNLIVLSNLGRQVEQRRGPLRYLLLVLLTAGVSNVAQYYLGAGVWNFGTGTLTITPSGNFGGMSGVLYGLFGYMWVKVRTEPEMGFELSTLTIVLMVVWLFVCLLDVVGEPVANVAHGVGLFMGLVLGYGSYIVRAVRER